MTHKFKDAGLLTWLENQPDEILDNTDFGIVKMDGKGTVLFYNKAESKISGLSKESAIGKHFFTEVAPCTNNFMVAEKYKKETLDEELPYIFSYITKPTPVNLRLLKGVTGNQYLLVERT